MLLAAVDGCELVFAQLFQKNACTWCAWGLIVWIVLLLVTNKVRQHVVVRGLLAAVVHKDICDRTSIPAFYLGRPVFFSVVYSSTPERLDTVL